MKREATMLDQILDRKREHVANRERTASLDALKDTVAYSEPRRGFVSALIAGANPVALIAEVKKASPSRGLICSNFDPAQIASQYEQAGASCLSVLTDEPFFHGSDQDLIAARATTSLPTLRKDFIIDTYQLHESKAFGADCILLIVAAFESATMLHDLHEEARSIALDVLVEVHDEHELLIAENLKPNLLGINNRNLRTFETDIATTERLMPLAPKDCVVVSESAIRDHADVCRVASAGAKAILVGESLLSQGDLVNAVRSLLGK